MTNIKKIEDISKLFEDEHEIIIKFKDKEYTFKVRSLNLGDYIDLFNNEGEADTVKVIQRCLIYPKLTEEELKKLPIGIALNLYKEISERSFL